MSWVQYDYLKKELIKAREELKRINYLILHHNARFRTHYSRVELIGLKKHYESYIKSTNDLLFDLEIKRFKETKKRQNEKDKK